MSQIVQYDIRIIAAEAIAALRNLGKGFVGLQKTTTEASGTITKAEGAISRFAKGLMNAASAAWKAQEGVLGLAKATEKLTAEEKLQEAHRRQMQSMYRHGTHQAARGLGATEMLARGRMPHASMVGGLGAIGVGAVGGFMAGHAVGHVAEAANALDVARQRFGIMGASPDQQKQLLERAAEISGRFRNLSREEVLHGMLEDVSIYGTIEKALNEAEVHAQMSSILKSMEGGKHAGKGYEQEALSAVKSAELLGKFTPEQMAEYLPGLLAVKGLYGDQANLGAYLRAQRVARTAFLTQGEHFRMGVFPALVQELGPNAGVALATAFSSIIGGTKLTKDQQAEMKRYGLAGPDGRFSPEFQNTWKTDAFAGAQMLAERIAKTEGLRPGTKEQVAAGEATAGDAEKLTDLVMRKFPRLFPNRNAAGELTQMYIQREKLEKDAKALELTLKPITQIWKDQGFAVDDLNNKYAILGASWKNLLAEMGGPLLEPTKRLIDDLGRSMAGMAKDMHQGKGLMSSLGTALWDFGKKHPYIGAAGLGIGAALAGWILKGLNAGLHHMPARAALFGTQMLVGGAGMAAASAAGRHIGTIMKAAIISTIARGGLIIPILTELAKMGVDEGEKQKGLPFGEKSPMGKVFGKGEETTLGQAILHFFQMLAYGPNMGRLGDHNITGPGDQGRRDRDAYGALGAERAEQQVNVTVTTAEGAPVKIQGEFKLDSKGVADMIRSEVQTQVPLAVAKDRTRGVATPPHD